MLRQLRTEAAVVGRQELLQNAKRGGFGFLVESLNLGNRDVRLVCDPRDDLFIDVVVAQELGDFESYSSAVTPVLSGKCDQAH